VVTPEYNGGIPGILKYFIDMLKFPRVLSTGRCVSRAGGGNVGRAAAGGTAPADFIYRNAYLYPERVFLPQIYDLLDDAGRLKDAELSGRLKAQPMVSLILSSA